MDSKTKNINEQIAERMGWEYTNEPLPFHNGDHFFDLDDWDAVKAMQQKMVDDGWYIQLGINDEGVTAFSQHGEICQGTTVINTEPAAIVSLFCKVYGLEVNDGK